MLTWFPGVFARFLHYQAINFLFVISKYLGEIVWDYVSALLNLQTFTHDF